MAILYLAYRRGPDAASLYPGAKPDRKSVPGLRQRRYAASPGWTGAFKRPADPGHRLNGRGYTFRQQRCRVRQVHGTGSSRAENPVAAGRTEFMAYLRLPLADGRGRPADTQNNCISELYQIPAGRTHGSYGYGAVGTAGNPGRTGGYQKGGGALYKQPYFLPSFNWIFPSLHHASL